MYKRFLNYFSNIVKKQFNSHIREVYVRPLFLLFNFIFAFSIHCVHNFNGLA